MCSGLLSGVKLIRCLRAVQMVGFWEAGKVKQSAQVVYKFPLADAVREELVRNIQVAWVQETEPCEITSKGGVKASPSLFALPAMQPLRSSASCVRACRPSFR